MNEITPELDKIIKKAKYMLTRAINLMFFGRIDKVRDLIKQTEELIEKFQENMPSELEETHRRLLVVKGNIFQNQGYLMQGFEVANQLLTIAGKYDNKSGISEGHQLLGNFYMRSNDPDKAFEHYDRALALKEELLNERGRYAPFVTIFTPVIEAAIKNNNIERARKYFTRLEEYHELYPNDGFITQRWKVNKANLLSVSIRSRDRVKAEELLEELIQDKSTTFFIKVVSLQILCKLFFVELRVTNDSGVIDDIKALFPKMVELAQQFGSIAHLVDFYTIQGKLALLTFDFKTARRLLTQARRIAERHKYLLAAAEIARLQEELEHQLTSWEYLKEKESPFSERMDLARLDEHLTDKFRAHMIREEVVVEEDVTVYKSSQTCMVCKGHVGGYDVFICPHCQSHYCKTCAQAVTDLENECWTCNSPIDVSKPVTPYEPEQEEVKVRGKGKESKSPKKK